MQDRIFFHLFISKQTHTNIQSYNNRMASSIKRLERFEMLLKHKFFFDQSFSIFNFRDDRILFKIVFKRIYKVSLARDTILSSFFLLVN